MKELARLAVDDALRAGAQYADFRFEQRDNEAVHMKNGKVEGISRSTTEGFGIRVLVGGSWGFSSSHDVSRESVQKVVQRAVALAREARGTQKQPVKLDDTPLAKANYRTPVKRDPFTVPVSEKAALLEECHRRMSKVQGIFLTEGTLQSWRKRQLLLVSGSEPVEQEIVECGGGVSAYALEGSELQRRSYPASHGGNYATAGWEFVEEMKMPEGSEAAAREAVELLKAPLCPEGEFPLVIGTSQLALQIHESVGHPTELDRIFGTEISFAGGSWVKPEMIGSVKYGSPVMNIICDATLERGLGTFGFDDEGIPARRYHMVQDGILVDALSSRETAPRIGKRSGGAMRADGWNRLPLVRMTNVSLPWGNLTFDQLIADIEHGIYVEVNKSWSIDDKRLNFQFATEYAREIRKGKLGGLLRNPVYWGIGPQFWSELEALGDRSTWQLWGIPNCGKGQPMQTAHVGHGAPAGRFRKVKVGHAK